jgi:hypothetical protein
VATGLPFHVNADFLLNASRESYRRDHPWNKQIEANFLSLLSLSARSLAKVPPSAMLVDPLQLVPVSEAAKWMKQEIVEMLKQEPIVPAWKREKRVCGTQCILVPSDLIALTPWKELPHDFPHPFLVNRSITDVRFGRQIGVVGVQTPTKAMLMDIIRAQLDGRGPEDMFYKQLYACMANNFENWTPDNTAAIKNFLLLENGQQVTLTSHTGISIWPYFSAFQSQDTLKEYFPRSMKLANSTLPSDQRPVKSWFSAWDIYEVDSDSAVRRSAQFLREETCTSAQVLEATFAMLSCDKSFSLKLNSLPLVCTDGSIKQPPFSLLVVRSSEPLLELFGESDRGHFHVMSPEYDRYPSYAEQLGHIFGIRSPPWPPTFSWMSSPSMSFTEHFSELILKLTQLNSNTIPTQIKRFLDTRPWLPSTMGLRVPHEVYCPTPDLRDIFGTSVAYCKDDIYGIFIF